MGNPKIPCPKHKQNHEAKVTISSSSSFHSFRSLWSIPPSTDLVDIMAVLLENGPRISCCFEMMCILIKATSKLPLNSMLDSSRWQFVKSVMVDNHSHSQVNTSPTFKPSICMLRKTHHFKSQDVSMNFEGVTWPRHREIAKLQWWLTDTAEQKKTIQIG